MLKARNGSPEKKSVSALCFRLSAMRRQGVRIDGLLHSQGTREVQKLLLFHCRRELCRKARCPSDLFKQHTISVMYTASTWIKLPLQQEAHTFPMVRPWPRGQTVEELAAEWLLDLRKDLCGSVVREGHL